LSAEALAQVGIRSKGVGPIHRPPFAKEEQRRIQYLRPALFSSPSLPAEREPEGEVVFSFPLSKQLISILACDPFGEEAKTVRLKR
jgi:hypothetical protein